MNGLKVYINPDKTDALTGSKVFYSCREGGPYYRWHYEEEAGQWLFARAHPYELIPKALCHASWREVPMSLQTRLGEHYLD